jgi:mRNA interferase YafQ
VVKRLKLGKIGSESALKIKEGSYFRKDVQRMIELLASGKPLPGDYKDHALAKEWADYRECHIEADFLLIYKSEGNFLILERVGTHSDLFQ